MLQIFSFDYVFVIVMCYFGAQNVPPAILLRFLREHRSEWADNNMDAYSAAAIKVGPCSFSGSRDVNYGGQVILPLAHTIEHEEVTFPQRLKNNHKFCKMQVDFLLTYCSFWKLLNWKEWLILPKTQ